MNDSQIKLLIAFIKESKEKINLKFYDIYDWNIQAISYFNWRKSNPFDIG